MELLNTPTKTDTSDGRTCSTATINIDIWTDNWLIKIVYQELYKKLYKKMYVELNTAQASSADVKQAFLIAGIIQTGRRSRTAPDTLEDLLFLNSEHRGFRK